jgi:hypothetical protein
MTEDKTPADRPFFLTIRMLPAVFLSVVAIAVVVVIGSIAINAFNNHGLIPPPSQLAHYDCLGSASPFSIDYLHGTERVTLQSPSGTLDGTVHQNQFDWGRFAGDATLLGLVPPASIAFEDAHSLYLASPAYPEVKCVNHAEIGSQRRAIVQ